MSAPHSNFDVLVMATMSAGKTSLINALIGHEILHVANEATTACHTQIEHQHDATYFTGTCYSHSELLLYKQQDISPEQIRNWNTDSQIRRIAISGRFSSCPSQTSGLVLHDTPGPNNSQDARHAALAFETVQSVPFKSLLYVLDASQLGTHDDRKILERLRAEAAPKSLDTFCFVLNKVDLLDPEKGEVLEEYVAKAKAYLTGIGFDSPVVIPSMASTALYAKMALAHQPLSRRQQLKLQQALDDFSISKYALLKSAQVPISVNRHVFQSLNRLEKAHEAARINHRPILENELRQLIIYSGLGTIEAFIKHQHKQSIPA